MRGHRAGHESPWRARWAVIARAICEHGARDGPSWRPRWSVIARAMGRDGARQVWPSRARSPVIAAIKPRFRRAGLSDPLCNRADTYTAAPIFRPIGVLAGPRERA